MSVPELYRGGPAQPAIDVQATSVPPAPDRLDFRALLTTLNRRIWLFGAIALTILGAAAFVTFTATPTYTATARVMLETRQREVAPTAGDPAQSGGDAAAVDTEVELIRSRTIAAGVVEALKLEQDPDFNPTLAPSAGGKGLMGNVKDFIKRTLGRATPADAKVSPTQQAEVREAVVDRVLGGLTTQRVGITYAIDLFYSGRDPRKAALIANTFAQLYTQEKLGLKVQENQQAVSLLGGRIEELRLQAQADTAAVQHYRIANNLLSTSGASLTEQEISAYNQAVAQARAQAAEDIARLNTARAQLRGGSAGDDVGEALGSPVIQSLRAQRAAKSARVAELEGRYGPRHPDLIKARRELSDTDVQIQAEITRIISNLEAKAKVSGQRVASLQGSLHTARGSLQQNNRAMVGLDELERKAQTSQALYESYLNRLKEASAQEGTQRADARVISSARTPTRPSSPNVGLNLLLGLLLGVGAGLGAAFLAEMLSSSFTTSEDVEQQLGQPYLGGIPLLSSVEAAGRSVADSVVDHPLSAYAEAFRSMRTALRYGANGAAQVVAMTSALPQEGKTSTSLGLARTAALQGQRVVMVDCDLRRHGLTRLVGGRRPAIGLVQLLMGEGKLEDALVLDERSGAMILPIVGSQRDHGELLEGEEMDTLLADLRRRFDFIVLDTAPVLPVAETRSLVTKVDALVFAIRWRKTPDHAVRAAFRLLPRGQVNLAGVTLTRVDLRKQSRYGYGDPGFYYKQYKQYYA
jgi:succinoglycan biosynthesis transport protein ExoP